MAAFSCAKKMGGAGKGTGFEHMKIPVSKFGQELQEKIDGRDLIVFDGECVLCSGFFRFMLRHDREERFSFAMAQAEVGQACYAALGMPLEDFQTNLVIKDGWIFTDLDAFAAAMAALSWPWKALAVAAWLPGIIKRPLYRVIAKNRYKIFGRYETCMMPDASLRARFVQGGWL
ncbi:MAG: DCC1-like thiol-disulfide oxidoreductase family protein [Pseudomonadota bacterium]